MTDDFSLPVAFHFSVVLGNSSAQDPDAAFQEVSGLESRMELETVVEGGENRFVHHLPKPVQQGTLMLKRGLTDRSSNLVTWCKNTLEGDFSTRIQPRDLVVSLLNEEAEPVASWSIGNAFPVKWSVAGFDAMKNEIALETVELAYLTLKRTI